jgi:alpha,alpha-trehalase
MLPAAVFEINPLFADVQMASIFADGKTFVDCTPRSNPEAINALYLQEKDQSGFSLHDFVHRHFIPPTTPQSGFSSSTDAGIEAHIESLWQVLTRETGHAVNSLIPLPHPFVVPGGRFGEMYYWDSYFTMLGLRVAGKINLLENMVKNFAHLIHRFGFIPNGNRRYYLSRSQPPYFALMVQLLAEEKGDATLSEFLPQLEREYDFWMQGSEALSDTHTAIARVVRLPGTVVLNRYWDAQDTPRPESYREDVELAQTSQQLPAALWRHLRAGAESGWDYSSRWFKDERDFTTICTTDIIPVDLNCLLWLTETIIASAHRHTGNAAAEAQYLAAAEARKTAIQQYCWHETLHFYVDYNWRTASQKSERTLAGIMPLYAGVATSEQAAHTAAAIEKDFLHDGGVVTTLTQTGQQWDAPNGWAPLQWLTVNGLDRYGYTALATETARRWLQLNRDVFARTGKLMEKYNVTDTHLEAGGGEYPGQDGFGWTNGVYLALHDKYF